MDLIGVISLVGALAFGVVMGWVTYRTLRRAQTSGLSDIATVIGAVGGAAVTALFPKETGAFGAYCVGLAVGFFAYLAAAARPDAPPWLGVNLPEPPVRGGQGGGALPPPAEPR